SAAVQVGASAACAIAEDAERRSMRCREDAVQLPAANRLLDELVVLVELGQEEDLVRYKDIRTVNVRVAFVQPGIARPGGRLLVKAAGGVVQFHVADGVRPRVSGL